ncbi:HpcH/HpaI aldolase/citrate lyase family protein [Paenibacillus arenilitoris]|uniref:HpcH/HpaI aldolase/citrate lyase family protein n=1 Tax=Paenibacillus arenilitoris TaxID=2772299 RepID=A0A927CLH4_9BACL|nr:HpcH/HpaI aldolase/citrate lyase family protein [Paenibacillus arenilitoris]MBD2869397.1 HpcH/HpaI aldolase/citrate lyase family protein [Paenibacillus arenilitoris]
MRYFNYLTVDEEQSFFHSLPRPFDNKADKEVLAHAVGAALYMPATKESIADDLAAGKHEGLVSMVIDLEDAVGDNQIEYAEELLKQSLLKIGRYLSIGLLQQGNVPLLFIRVRSVDQLKRLLSFFGEEIEYVTGIVFPKFNVETGGEYLRILAEYNRRSAASRGTLYGMPILESSEVIYREKRIEALLGIFELLRSYKAYILNVRIGATDFSSLFGLRRSPDHTIYDIGVIRDCIADIVNVFGRMDDHYVISGPVWEYFKSDRVFKPQLRQTPFEESMGRSGRILRMDYINRYVDGLIREVAMDKENGMIGKTIIHPTHIRPVQSMYVVTHEEYMDALHIIENGKGDHGVMKSRYSNKMNEFKPHMTWAGRIMIRANVYGVLNENQNFTCLLAQERESAIV